MDAPRITVIGSSNVDLIMKLPRLPAVGETVTDGLFTQVFGGKGANTAVAAARAGGRVTLVNAVGDDPFAPTMIRSFEADGINTSQILRVAGVHSGTALVMFDGGGRNYLAVAPGANYELMPEHVDACASIIASSTMVLMQMEIRDQTIERGFRIASEAKVPVLFNWAPARRSTLRVDARMSVLVVNENEAAALAGIPVSDTTAATEAAGKLGSMGPQTVIITLGAQGAVVCDAGHVTIVPAFPVKAVDTTAAGDTFCGALGVALGGGLRLENAVRFASAAAAISVTRVGAQPSIPTRREIDELLHRG
jgi:ribokinase